jgi:amino acid adenylation domain-containing protein
MKHLISELYNLVFDGFEINIVNNALKVIPPADLSAARRDNAKAFIGKNKDFIYEIFANKSYNTNSILNFNNIQSTDIELSFAQDRLRFLEKYEEGTNAYNIPLIFKLKKDVDLNLLDESIKSVISRHEVLRTLIKENADGIGYQHIIEEKNCLHKLSVSKVTDSKHLEEQLNKISGHIYDLSSEYPIKVSIYELENNSAHLEYYIAIVIHHIAFDGWSIEILLRELNEFYFFYKATLDGLDVTLNLPVLDIQYKDFALWQRNYLTGDRLVKQLTYWKKKLSGYEQLNLVTDNVRPAKIDYRGLDLQFEIDAGTSDKLRAVAQELEVSMYSLLLAAYFLLLRSYSNQNDIIVGTPASNRHYTQIENHIGFFVNTLPIRIEIFKNENISDFIKRVAMETIDAQINQDLPFEKLVEHIKVEKDQSRHPIFQIMFGVESFGGAPTVEKSLFDDYDFETTSSAKFDIAASIDDSSTCIKGNFNFAISLYSESTIAKLIDTYKILLKQFSELADHTGANSKIKVADINYLNQEVYTKILQNNNMTNKLYPSNNTLHELFELQVELTPHNIAVIYENTQLTYKELNERANRLAVYLRSITDIQPDTLIALCLERSEFLLIAALAVLKAGGAYVPMDPRQPMNRLNYILEDTNAPVLITQNNLAGGLSRENIMMLTIESLFIAILSGDSRNLKNLVKSDHLAYVIYTSGSTGQPKGVMIEHKSVVNYLSWCLETYPAQSGKGTPIHSSPSFDMSITGLFMPLLSGSTVHFIPDKLDPTALLSTLKDSTCEFSFIKLTPSHLKLLAADLSPDQIRNQSEALIIGGENLATKDIEFWRKHSPNTKLFNEYGPTEATVACCVFEINDTDKNKLSVPIGKPIANTSLYILNESLKPVPMGATGELYIGGEGLARGYLNRAELTAERFKPNPFQTQDEKTLGLNFRIYKTGDLVRMLADGNLEYLGRNDFQVKIRGYRIELGEIEKVLGNYTGINQCIVLAKGNSDNKYLIGYYVSEIKQDENEIQKYLNAQLPDYLVPTALIRLDSFPLTENGKLDIKSLPNPEFTNIKTYVEPKNELEIQLCSIWADLLGLSIDQVGIQDNFFRLGGNSVMVLSLVSKLNSRFTSHLKVSDVFIHPSIELLIPRIIQTRNSYQTIVKLNKTTTKPNLFMIHPGTSGVEVYTSLANKLKTNFSCYGLDSYNLYNENKIPILRELANYYLSNIEKIMQETGQENYYLLGWSLGGLIALEIASLLEERKVKNIKLFILDTFINDDNLQKIMDSMDHCKLKSEFEKGLMENNYDQSYIHKILSCIDVEHELSQQVISSTLNTTEIYLFKALLRSGTRVAGVLGDRTDYIIQLELNNLDMIADKKNINLISMYEFHHENMLKDEMNLVKSIISMAFNDKYFMQDCKLNEKIL